MIARIECRFSGDEERGCSLSFTADSSLASTSPFIPVRMGGAYKRRLAPVSTHGQIPPKSWETCLASKTPQKSSIYKIQRVSLLTYYPRCVVRSLASTFIVFVSFSAMTTRVFASVCANSCKRSCTIPGSILSVSETRRTSPVRILAKLQDKTLPYSSFTHWTWTRLLPT